MKNGFAGRFFFVVVLLVAFSSLGLAAVCVPTPGIITGDLTQSAMLTTPGLTCTNGAYTFSNFEVFGASIPVAVPTFSLSLSTVSVSPPILGFSYSNLSLSSTDDIDLTYQISPGVSEASLTAGPGVTVTELICSVPTGTGGSCPSTDVLNTSVLSASNGSSSASAVTLAPTDYVFKDISGGSDVTQDFAPEPVTFSLMGLGLIALGFAGRKRLRKD